MPSVALPRAVIIRRAKRRPVSTRVLSEQSGTIAYFAHIGGFSAGVLLCAFFTKSAPARQGRRYRYYH